MQLKRLTQSLQMYQLMWTIVTVQALFHLIRPVPTLQTVQVPHQVSIPQVKLYPSIQLNRLACTIVKVPALIPVIRRVSTLWTVQVLIPQAFQVNLHKSMQLRRLLQRLPLQGAFQVSIRALIRVGQRVVTTPRVQVQFQLNMQVRRLIQSIQQRQLVCTRVTVQALIPVNYQVITPQTVQEPISQTVQVYLRQSMPLSRLLRSIQLYHQFCCIVTVKARIPVIRQLRTPRIVQAHYQQKLPYLVQRIKE